MKMVSKQDLKNILGQIPLTAEAYWYLRQPGKPITPEFTLDQLERSLPIWREQIINARSGQNTIPASKNRGQKRVFIFGTLRYWIEHASLLGMALAGFGHSVIFSYLPYARWQVPIDSFNLRRQNLYAEGVLGKGSPLIKVVPLLNHGNARRIPSELLNLVDLVSLRDTQYTLQVEEVSQDSDLYKLRSQRNCAAACAAFFYLRRHKPDVVILPNGTILEFGMLYQVARFLDIPVVTYEFGEQRDRIWIAQNSEVMRQQTDDLWQARKHHELTQEQQNQVQKLFASRQRGSLWENFSRRWQGVPSEGGEQVRQTLGLDHRPIILLATNVKAKAWSSQK